MKKKPASRSKPQARRLRPTVAPKPVMALTIRDPQQLLAQQEQLIEKHLRGATAPLQPLTEAPLLSPVHIGTLQLTEAQIVALRRPVEDREIEFKPTRKDNVWIPYMSHNGYRERFDAAFGIGRWGTIPAARPELKDGTLIQCWALVVGGVAVAYAYGAQEDTGNKLMDWGDILEGVRSNAIVRLGKELGVARELWDKRYLSQLLARLSPANGRPAARQQPASRPPPSVREQTSTGEPKKDTRPLSEGQVERLYAIAGTLKRDKPRLKAWIQATYHVKSSKEIQRWQYDDLVSAIESGDCYLEPGSDG